MERILLTGGAGYIGSVLTRRLLEEGYFVRVVDNLRHENESILEVRNHDRFEFFREDIRNRGVVEKSLQATDHVVHLAAIVGDPACEKEKELAQEVNYDAPVTLFEMAKEAGVQTFLFASTCSVYGRMAAIDYIDEEGRLAPLSLYAQLKTKLEEYILTSRSADSFFPVCLRFATAYGLSPRMRFDLTVNEFTKDAFLGRELSIYGEQFWRPYCHVIDIANSIIHVLRADRRLVAREIFNVGNTDENYTKRMLADLIREYIPHLQVRYVPREEDPRDYKVSFGKISKKLGFRTTRILRDGIEEILFALKNNILLDPDAQRYRNT